MSTAKEPWKAAIRGTSQKCHHGKRKSQAELNGKTRFRQSAGHGKFEANHCGKLGGVHQR